MSTYLQLSQDLRREAGITSSSGDTPTSVVNQTGELRRVVEWAKKSWTEIQNRHTNWRWMRRQFTVNTVADTDEYASADCTDVDDASSISRFSHWWTHDLTDPPKCYLSADGVGAEYRLNYIRLEDFRRLYKFGSGQSGRPAHISVDHKNQIVLGPNPDDVYVVTGDYQRSAQIFSADNDTPEMPTQFHDLIVWYALEHYAYHEAATDSLMQAKKSGKRMLRQLEANQLPQLWFAVRTLSQTLGDLSFGRMSYCQQVRF